MKTLLSVITLLFIQITSAYAACLPPTSDQAVRLQSNWYVVDGDTLHFSKRNKLRLAMINAPELGRDGRPDQPFAQASTQAVDAFLAGGQLQWQVGLEAKDRYGRWLGSVLNHKGEWLAAHLVGNGLAYVISVGDNAAPACLWQLESQARRDRLGLWGHAIGRYQSSRDLGQDDGGFKLIAGKVEKVAAGGGHWYVDLQGVISLKINQQEWRQLGGTEPRGWLGKELQIRGWVNWRKLSKQQRQKGFKPALLYVQHPHMLTVFD